jgi:transglutaminase-like putative cysteine protease
MNTPRLLMGAALLFWGWQTGLWLWGAALATALEASYFIRARWELSDTDLNRICDLCLVLFLGTALVLYSTEDRLMLIFKFAQSLPFCFFPIALAQAYGNRRAMPLSAFSWLLRRAPKSPLARKSFNISYAYFALCLLAASASTRPSGWFYIGISLLVLLALSHARPRRVSWPAWIALAGAVLLCGGLSHQGLRQLQMAVESALDSWIVDLFHAPANARECRTRIGRPGAVTLSDRIALRVRVPPGDVPPTLLRECAYDSYKNGTWSVASNDYINVSVSGDGMARLLAPKPVFSSVEIACYFQDGEGLLALPHGAFEIEDFPAFLSTNRLGVAKVQGGPGLLDYRVEYWPGTSVDARPGPLDLAVPSNEIPALETVAAKLGLEGMTGERQKIRAVSRYFHDHFTYSLNVPGNVHESALAWFLTNTYAGHCEYFATATVLLLRQAGVHARYVTGYAMPETARPGNTYLVRERHAHAWALAYDGKIWEQVDNTPSSWMDAPEARPPWWEPASDFMSNLYFDFSKWRWSKTSYARYARWALAPLVLFLVWRIVSTGRRQRPAPAPSAAAEPSWPGLDSELYQINRRLAEVNLSRQPNEPLALWQGRLEEAFPASPALRRVFRLHRRLRFDPRGLGTDDREALRRQAGEWLAEFSAHLEQRTLAGPN